MGLEIHNIVKIYDKKILDGVNCRLTGGLYGLLAPDGAGKSTLIRAVCDLEPPTAGSILYDGEPVSALGERYREILGYVPQKMGFYPDYTAREFLQYMAGMKGIRKKELRRRVDEALEWMNLTNVGRKKIKKFSGSMKQRLGIAQAILGNPKLLVLDEPMTGLGVEEQKELKRFISEYSRDRIVLFATHTVADIEDIGKEILILKDGKIKAQAAPVKLLSVVKGRIWDCECDKSEVSALKKKYKVSKIKEKGERIKLRLLANQKPMEHAVPVEGSMLDLYQFLFQTEQQDLAGK